ncbi:carbon storage regulator CsrA [Gimesia maris]|uniref:Translational regulator CsrA n=1 Tax=Gimesia maris TaxID=122 RepID=A0A3D3R5T4_9PLAN|nr:carbon storage regulator CsrA [Gimesia maris]MAC51672.1 carbon storage regulator [Gimesia sp.]HAW31817.1 carbon storage regulator [Planctomycetaceae bacterium]EDL61624.1 carbon storage regulator [Gimesia maris DSM 8797]QDT77411.1 Carbon storage regulator [Gimesia maris]QDU13051.1 Carbon storage regulator [Gimesia maris]|tara:strand:- start:149245 stop:149445 length:201 start_codon:yes stop_codon:yes gene_type:complete
MLVLTRRKDEEIIINNNISIKVLSVKGNRVRLGVEAPDDVSVNRAEIRKLVQQFEVECIPAQGCGL